MSHSSTSWTSTFLDKAVSCLQNAIYTIVLFQKKKLGNFREYMPFASQIHALTNYINALIYHTSVLTNEINALTNEIKVLRSEKKDFSI